MSRKTGGFIARLLARATSSAAGLRKWLARTDIIFRMLMYFILMLLVALGITGLFYFHPTDNYSAELYEQLPKELWLLLFGLVSVAAIYGLTETTRIAQYGESRRVYAWIFFFYSLIRLWIMLMIITCFFLLFVRNEFANDEILRGDLVKHYGVIIIDALTVGLFGQWKDLIADKTGMMTLEYDVDGIYGGVVHLFKVSIIVMTTWTLHKFIIFESPADRERRIKAYWLNRSKEEDENKPE